MSAPAWFVCRWLVRRAKARQRPDPLLLASTWDLLAACLRGGLPVSVAVLAISRHLSGAPSEALRRTAELAALGADPATAWEPALAEPVIAELARAARRSARSGIALAAVAEGMAAHARSSAADWAEAKAQRAAVAVAGPLGLCFLPAFLCLGVTPAVIGLAGRLTSTW
jgi:pilus assembly protein TadC